MEKPKKIDIAIRDLKHRIEKVQMDIQLLIREQDTLKTQLFSLEAIRESKEFE